MMAEIRTEPFDTHVLSTPGDATKNLHNSRPDPRMQPLPRSITNQNVTIVTKLRGVQGTFEQLRNHTTFPHKWFLKPKQRFHKQGVHMVPNGLRGRSLHLARQNVLPVAASYGTGP